MRKLEREFADELVVVGVHTPKFPAEKDSANLRQAVLRLGLAHPVVNDADFAIWQSFAVRAWPTLMLIDPRGKVVGKHEGEFDPDALHGTLRQMIGSFAAEGLIDRTPLTPAPEREQDGPLRFPGKVLADGDGGRLFIADSGHHRILEAAPDGAVRRAFGDGQSGLRDGSADAARFDSPQGMALDPDGSSLYVADTGNHALRRIDLASGAVETVAGTGERGQGEGGGRGTEIPLASPWDLTFLDGMLWVAMAGLHQLWTFDPATGIVELAAGTGVESIHDGALAQATFAQPSGIAAIDGALYVADSETSAVRVVDPAADRVRRLVGRGLFDFGDIDACGDSVRLQHPLGLCAAIEDGEPVVYIADTYNDKIKRLIPSRREVATVAGGDGRGLADGAADTASFWEPGGLSLFGRSLYVADTNNHAIRVIDLDTRIVRTLQSSTISQDDSR